VKLENPVESDSQLIAMYDNNIISSINPDTGEVTLMNTTVNNNGVIGADIYTSRLYIINKDTDQIIRYKQGNASFQAGSNWLEIPNDLSKAHDIAVDGNVYILEAGNGIIQFDQGTRTNWHSEQLDPSIDQATKLTTNVDSDYLYILDPANKRFLVYNKQGDFLQQFTSPQFDNLIDIAIIENGTNMTAYLLNNSAVIKVNFELK